MPIWLEGSSFTQVSEKYKQVSIENAPANPASFFTTG
jgi:hypothetical protein